MTDPTILDTPVAPDPMESTRRRRRPTGKPPPLPRSIGVSGRLWLFLSVALLVWVPAALAFQEVERFADQADTAFLRQVARLRTDWLTTIADRVDRLASGWTPTLMIVVTIIAIIAAVAIAVYQDIVKKSKLAADQAVVSSLRSAIAIDYGRSNGLFPASMTTVETLVQPAPSYNCTVPPVYDSANGKITFTATLSDCP